MKAFLPCLLSLLVVGSAALDAQIITLRSVGVYDPVTVDNTNTVDRDVPSTQQVSSSIEVAPFTTNVLAAFNANLGGVADFDGGDDSVSLSSDLATGRMNLGITSALQLDLTISMPNTPNVQRIEGPGFGPISGERYLQGRQTASFTFNGVYDAAGTTLLTDHGVKEFGITMLDRDRSWLGDVVVTFSDNTTQTISDLSRPASATNPGGVNDTFVGFVAPGNLFIQSVAFNHTSAGDYTLIFDDLGIVVIPEPRVYAALFGLFALGFVVWRRRVRR